MSELVNAEIDPTIAAKFQKLDELPLQDVDALKKQIERELESNFQKLANEHADMDSPLVINGYPRSDIDVLHVRLIRHNVNVLQNDLRKVLERSHELINQHFGELQVKTRQEPTIESRIPFARITDVVAGGPADKAMLQLDDRLVSLGSVHAGNHMKLKNLQNTVIQNEDTQLHVKIIRNGSIIHLTLTPSRNWQGRGLLGCRVVEL